MGEKATQLYYDLFGENLQKCKTINERRLGLFDKIEKIHNKRQMLGNKSWYRKAIEYLKKNNKPLKLSSGDVITKDKQFTSLAKHFDDHMKGLKDTREEINKLFDSLTKAILEENKYSIHEHYFKKSFVSTK